MDRERCLYCHRWSWQDVERLGLDAVGEEKRIERRGGNEVAIVGVCDLPGKRYSDTNSKWWCEAFVQHPQHRLELKRIPYDEAWQRAEPASLHS